jgi:hypothetical protein
MHKMLEYFKTRTGHFGECWKHARRHRAVAVILLLGSAYVAYTSWGSLIKVPDWAKPDNLPKLPIPWAVTIILVAVLFVVIEGSYRLHHRHPVLELSASLSTLPVYAQDLKIELLSFKRGVDYLEFEGGRSFLSA